MTAAATVRILRIETGLYSSCVHGHADAQSRPPGANSPGFVRGEGYQLVTSARGGHVYALVRLPVSRITREFPDEFL